MSLSELVHHSDVILVGRTARVESINAIPWGGTRWQAKQKAMIQVEQVLKGRGIPTEIEVLFGIDFICDITDFKESTRYVLFLKRDVINGHTYYKLTNFDTAQFWIKGEEVITPRWTWAGLKPAPLGKFLEKIQTLLSGGKTQEERLSRTAAGIDEDTLLTIAQNRALTLGYKPDDSTMYIKPTDSWWRSTLRANPEFSKKVDGKEIQLVQFLPKYSLSGDAVVVLDKESGVILDVLTRYQE